MIRLTRSASVLETLGSASTNYIQQHEFLISQNTSDIFSIESRIAQDIQLVNGVWSNYLDTPAMVTGSSQTSKMLR